MKMEIDGKLIGADWGLLFSKESLDEEEGNLGLRAQRYFFLRHRIFSSLTEDSAAFFWIYESIAEFGGDRLITI
jgi:hypothetical protein